MGLDRAHLIVIASAEEDVVGGWVPLHEANAPAVPVQLQDSLCHVPLQPALRDLPDPHLWNGMGWDGFGSPRMTLTPAWRSFKLLHPCSAPIPAASSCTLRGVLRLNWSPCGL